MTPNDTMLGFNEMKGKPIQSGWWAEMDTLRVAAKKLKT